MHMFYVYDFLLWKDFHGSDKPQQSDMQAISELMSSEEGQV